MDGEDNLQEQEPNLVSFRSAYQEYSNLFGMFGAPVLNIPHRLENQAHSGYIVNKSLAELLKRITQNGAITYIVYDHIRHVQETLTGIFTVDNSEFKHILREFMAEFIMDEVCIIYSEEVNLLEQALLQKAVKGTQEDLWLRQQKAKFQSNFRLFKRVPDETTGKYGWKSVLTNISNIKLTPEQEKLIKRVSFNDGFFFLRLFKIFSTYEAQMQSYIRLFKTLHKSVVITGNNSTDVNNKLTDLLSANVHISKTQDDIKHGLWFSNAELHKDIPNLDLSYHVIQTQLNDSLGRLGLGGDDSTKAERVTTGENFRALQPNSAFQQAMLLELNNVSDLISSDGMPIYLKFDLALKPNMQGVPVEGGGEFNNDQRSQTSGKDKE